MCLGPEPVGASLWDPWLRLRIGREAGLARHIKRGGRSGTRRGRRTTPWTSTRRPLRRGCRGSSASRRATPAGWHADSVTYKNAEQTMSRTIATPPRRRRKLSSRNPGAAQRRGLPGPPSASRTPKAEPVRSRPQASRSDGPPSSEAHLACPRFAYSSHCTIKAIPCLHLAPVLYLTVFLCTR